MNAIYSQLAGISYSKKGNSEKKIVFLHGYLESKEIWTEFANFFSNEFTVLCIDLPGHGNTKAFSNNHSMQFMASIVKKITDFEQFEQFALIGHSMGGYVSLQFAEDFPKKIKSLVLFHSHIFADNDEKKQNRNKEIKLVTDGLFSQIVSINIPNMYANFNLQKFAEKIEFSKQIAQKTPETGVIAALNGMKNREDKTEFVKHSKFPFLFIQGKFDNLIPFHENDIQYTLNKNIELTVLESGHMGMFEDKENALISLNTFLHKPF